MTDLLWRTAGGALGAVFGVAARLRRAGMALHPRGHVAGGTLVRYGLPVPTGSAWLDEQGTDEVLVRRSRSAGLPGPLPDVHGLAVRVPVGGSRSGDLLLATTGTPPVLRHLLRPTTSDRRPMTTLLPYRTPTGPVVVGAFPLPGSAAYELRVAGLTGPWRRFATLDVRDDEHAEAADGPDTDVRFDPVLHPLPGLVVYDWVARLREPSYARSREGRRRLTHPSVGTVPQ